MLQECEDACFPHLSEWY